ncbi:MAG: 30S ribosomal protein S1, partial [Bryobacteraceae bacterium]
MNSSNVSAFPPDSDVPPSGDVSFGSILSQFEEEQHDKPGEGVRGTVVSLGPDSVFVDIGRKMDGVLPIEKVRGENGETNIRVGDELVVSITGRDQEGSYLLSTLEVARPKDWSAFEKAFADQTPIAGTVTELVKGGLRVDCGVKAFLPASRSGARDQAEIEKLVGQEIQCRIVKLDIADEDVVVDRRVILEEEERKARDRAFDMLQEGAVLRGVVRSLTDFGAFVDLGGVDGLLHVADMSWTRVTKPSDVVSPGDSIEVKVLKVSPENRRVSLGLKQLAADPWTIALEKFKVGDRVQGKVSRLMDFGAFVELMPGVEGLIHISEMSWTKKIRKPADVVKPDDLVDVVVLGVKPAEHRMSLGLKQALGDPWEEAELKFAPGTIVEGPVTSLTNFGAFVDLGNGIEGMIHISDISGKKRLNHPREALTAGETVKAAVLEMDKAKRRIRLSMKRLEPTSFDEYAAEHRVGDIVTGRVIEASAAKARVELGEGVSADCNLTAPASR